MKPANDQEPMQGSADEEQRDEYRLTGRVAVSIEVEAAESGRAARILRGSSRDLSANGVSLNAPEPLPQGALLPVTLTIDQSRPLTLMGEVRWCQPGSRGQGYRIGLEILESDDTAYLEWKESIASLLAMD
ncbi:MAG: PilZ domain-containing protein [Oleiphilaceae bacterium]|nr:PilZ domain-containing protein [Oleiphilaceae bacterium]